MKTFKEKVLIQMTKAVRLLEKEGYIDEVLNPMHAITKGLRDELNVDRVKMYPTERIVYNKNK